MIIVTIIALGILIAAAVYGVMLYNNLVHVKHNVSKAWEWFVSWNTADLCGGFGTAAGIWGCSRRRAHAAAAGP